MTTGGGGRRVAFGAAWSYGSQVATIMFQLAYAAIVSRLAGANEFGAYSVALSVTGLILLIANGGMSQAVARLIEVENSITGSLASFAFIMGAVVGAFTFFTSDFWANLWGAPGAADTIRWLSLGAVMAPWFSLTAGLARRQGQFAKLAIVTVIANVVGMVLGVVAVAIWGTASSLVVSAVSAQALLVAWLTWCHRQYLRPRSLSLALPHIVFSVKLLGAGVLQYAVGNIGKLSATRVFGPSVMGQWNRAEVLTTIPMQQAQSAMIQAVYPEFRHDLESSARAKAVWADMLLLVAWISLPAGMVLAVFAPMLIPWILGAEWDLAAQFAVPLSIGVAIQPVSVLLASALESLGSFRRIWATDVVLLLGQIALVGWMLSAKDVSIMVWGIALTNTVRMVLHVVLATRIGYLDFARFSRGFAAALVTAGFVWVLCKVNEVAIRFAINGGSPNSLWPLIGSLFILGAGAVILFLLRSRLPPIVLAKRHGLF